MINPAKTGADSGRLTVSKVIVTTAYCALVCAAITFSFKSLFFALFTDGGDNSVNEAELMETLSTAGAVSELTNGEVIKIQKALNDLGYDTGESYGIWSVKTQESLIKFQQSEGIDKYENGTVGQRTLDALGITIGYDYSDKAKLGPIKAEPK